MLNQPPLYIKNDPKYKLFTNDLVIKRNKHQGKFSGRKNQTNKWLIWINKNKDLLRFKGESMAEKRLFVSLYNCLANKVDGIRFDNKTKSWAVRFLSGYTCQKYKLCANCARLKANQNIIRFSRFLDQNPLLLQKNWYYMVLTVRHTIEDSFEDVYGKLISSLDKIRQAIKDSKRGKNKNSIFRHMDGALLAIEFTYGNNGRHPHINFLFCTDNLFPLKKIWNKQRKEYNTMNQEIADAWFDITKDSFSISLEKVVVKERLGEVLKYITKFSTLPDDRRLELFQKSHNFRFLRKWGLLYGAPIDEDNLESIQRYKYEILIPTKFDKERKSFVVDEDNFQDKFNNLNKEAIIEDGTLDILQEFFGIENWDKNKGFI